MVRANLFFGNRFCARYIRLTFLRCDPLVNKLTTVSLVSCIKSSIINRTGWLPSNSFQSGSPWWKMTRGYLAKCNAAELRSATLWLMYNNEAVWLCDYRCKACTMRLEYRLQHTIWYIIEQMVYQTCCVVRLLISQLVVNFRFDVVHLVDDCVSNDCLLNLPALYCRGMVYFVLVWITCSGDTLCLVRDDFSIIGHGMVLVLFIVQITVFLLTVI